MFEYDLTEDIVVVGKVTQRKRPIAKIIRPRQILIGGRIIDICII